MFGKVPVTVLKVKHSNAGLRVFAARTTIKDYVFGPYYGMIAYHDFSLGQTTWRVYGNEVPSEDVAVFWAAAECTEQTL